MQQHHVLSSYHFRRSKCDGLIEVLNEGSYVMAEYSERTGVVKWQRVVVASQREQIERWLGERYPVQNKQAVAAAAAAGRASSSPAPAAQASRGRAKATRRSA